MVKQLPAMLSHLLVVSCCSSLRTLLYQSIHLLLQLLDHLLRPAVSECVSVCVCVCRCIKMVTFFS